MNKILAGLIVFAVGAGAVIGWGWGLFGIYQTPEIRQAIAQQEQAKARAAMAGASTAEANAAAAWADATARQNAMDAIETSIRWGAMAGALAFAVGAVGLALAAVTWANIRARVIYPANGVYPIVIERRLNGSLVIADASRQLGAVTVTGYDGEIRQLPEPDMNTAARLASQGQAAAVMASAFKASTRTDAAEVARRVREAAVPVPVFARDVDAAGGDEPNFVYVKSATAGGNSRAQRELADIGEFIRLGWGPRGLSRRSWLGVRMAGTGNRITRAYYDAIAARLFKAGVITREGTDGGGWRPAVEEGEALDAFGLAHDDNPPDDGGADA